MRPNLQRLTFEYDPSDPEGFRSAGANLGALLGARELSVKAFELPPGEALCPYHYEYDEEWLVVLQGDVDLRTPAGTERLAVGDVVCFPSGPEGAHQVRSAGATARVLMFSTAAVPQVAVYPDSDKIGVWPGPKEDAIMVRREEASRPYFDREV
jgi:uncharacterized cupin superfamily protein